MSDLQSLTSISTTPTDALGGNASPQLATTLLAENSSNGRPDITAINASLAELAERDPALAAQTRTEIEARLGPVDAGNFARTAPVTGALADGTRVTFSPDGMEQGRWIETIRTSAQPADQALYGNLVRAAGTTDPEAIKAVLADAYARGIAPQDIAQPAAANDNGWEAQLANALDGVNPLNRLTDLLQPAAAEIGRAAGLGNTEWGARLQTLLETPGTLAAFRQGLNQGVIEGGASMATGIVELAGRAVQYGADHSLAGQGGDLLRSATGELPGWLDAVVPSANRGQASDAALQEMGANLGNYIASRANDPALIGQDAVRAFDSVWESVKADHAAAAAQGPEAEARWFGKVMGRATFEIGSTFIPVAGWAGKADKVVDGVRATETLADGARTADRLEDGLRAGDRVGLSDEAAAAARAAVRVEGATLVIDANRGRSFAVDGATGRIGDAPTVRTEGTRLITRDVDGNDVAVRQPRTFDSRTVQPDGSTVYTKGNQSVTYDANGFPVFRAKADLYLDPAHIKSADDGAHFRAANDMMRDALRADPSIAQRIGLTDAQVSFLMREPASSSAPPGLTWHHHQDTGRIQLVDRAEHFAFPGGHVGGMKLWGGGRD